MPCACGAQTPGIDGTPFYTAHLLANVVTESGESAISSESLAFLQSWLNLHPLEGVMKIEGELIPLSGLDLWKKLNISDLKDIINPKKIEAVGEKIIRSHILDVMQKLRLIINRPVTFAEAAIVVAYLYDGKTGKFAPIITQDISSRGITKFILGDNLDDHSEQNRVYLVPEQDPTVTLTGYADFKAIESEAAESYYELSNITYPLVVLVRTFNLSGWKMLIYL